MFVKPSTLIAIALAATATATESSKEDLDCALAAAAAYPAISAAPSPNAAIQSLVESEFATITDPCVIPAVTGSMAAEFTSWASQVVSWQSEYKDEILDFTEACEDNAYYNQLEGLPDMSGATCDKVTWLSGGSATTAANAAPRATGLGLAAAGVAAAAGLAIGGLH